MHPDTSNSNKSVCSLCCPWIFVAHEHSWFGSPALVMACIQDDLRTPWRMFITTIFAPALPELLWLPTVWRCPYIEIAFSTLDCSIVPTCGAWCSATAAKRGPLKQSWAEIQHSRDDEPLGVLMQMRNVRVNGFFFFDLRSAQVYCVAIFLVSQEVSLNFHRLCG